MTHPDRRFRQLIATPWKDYALIDSGHGRKLERYGRVTVDRPDPQAFWTPKRPVADWSPDAIFSSKGEEDAGNWQIVNRTAPDVWPMQWNGLTLNARRTGFRHMGIFPEHAVHWQFAQDAIRAVNRPVKVLNLFGYTGMMSIAAAAAGAEVTHLDASKKSIGYGREYQTLSGLDDKPVRWICDDALKFVQREARRGNYYDGIVLDPPKFGRGPKNETWRLEEDLTTLLAACRAILSDTPLFMITTVYAVRLSYLALAQTKLEHLSGLGGVLEEGEMSIAEEGTDRVLPTAIYARWSAG